PLAVWVPLAFVTVAEMPPVPLSVTVTVSAELSPSTSSVWPWTAATALGQQRSSNRSSWGTKRSEGVRRERCAFMIAPSEKALAKTPPAQERRSPSAIIARRLCPALSGNLGQLPLWTGRSGRNGSSEQSSEGAIRSAFGGGRTRRQTTTTSVLSGPPQEASWKCSNP